MKILVRSTLLLLLTLFIGEGVWADDYLWTGSVDSNWSTVGNWLDCTTNATATTAPGTLSTDRVLIQSSATVNLSANTTIEWLAIDTPTGDVVTLNLNGYTLNIGSTGYEPLELGTSAVIQWGIVAAGVSTHASSATRACTLVINGTGTINCETLDTNGSTNNQITLDSNVTLKVSGEAYLDQNSGTSTAFTGDNTSTVAFTGTSYNNPNVTFDGVNVSNGTSTYTIATSGTFGSGQTVTVTVTDSGGGSTQFQYEAQFTGTATPYTITSQPSATSTNITGNVTTATSFADTATSGTYTFTILYPTGMANPDGLNLSILVGGVPIGSVSYTAPSNNPPVWVGGNGTGAQQTDWSNANNWSTGVAPTATSAVEIAATSYVPVLTANSSASSVVVDSGATLDLASFNLTVSNSFTNNGTITLNGGASQSVTGTRVNGLGSIVSYNSGATSYPVWGGSYDGLTVTSGTTLSLDKNLTVSGTVTNGGTIAVGAHTLSFAAYSGTSDTVSVNGGTITNTGALATIGTLSVGASGVTLNGGTGITANTVTNPSNGALTVPSGTVTAASAWGALTISGGTYNVSAASSAASIALSSGTLSNGASTLSDSGTFNQSGGTFTQGTGGVTLNGVSNTFGGTFTPNASGLITFSGGAAQSLAANGVNLGNVTITGASTNLTVANQSVTFGNLTVQSSGALTLDAASGAVTLNLTAGDTLANSSTVTITNAGTNGVAIQGSAGIANFTGIVPTWSAGQKITLANLSFAPAITVQTGDTLTLGDSNVSFGSNVTVGPGTFNANGQNWSLAGNWDNSSTGTLLGTGGIATFSGTAKTINAGGAGTSPNKVFGPVSITGSYTLTSTSFSTGALSGTGSLNLGGNNVTVAGNLTLATLTATGSEAIAVSGNFVPATAFTAAASAVTLSGTGVTLTPAGNFYDLTINGTVTTLGGPLGVTRDVTFGASGGLAAGSNTINVGRNWIDGNASGSLSGTSTVSFDTTVNTAHTINGATAFSSLSIDASSAPAQVTVTFDSLIANQKTVGGTLTLKGKSGQNLLLTGPSQWYLNAAGSTSLSYLTVTNGFATTALTASASTGTGNTNWTLNGILWTGGTSSDPTVSTNWSGSIVPTPTDDAVIPNTGVTNWPDFTSGKSLTVNNLTVTATSGNGLTVSGGSLTVSGNLTSNAPSNVAITSGTLSVAGNLTTSGTFSFTQGSALTVTGTKTVSGTVTYLSGSPATYTSLALGNSYTNLAFASTAAGSIWQPSANLTAAGTLSVSANDILDLQTYNLTGPVTAFTNNGTLRLGGTQTVSLPAGAIGGTVEYTGTTAGLTLDGLTSFTNLTMSGTGGTWTPAGSVTVAGNLTLTAGTLALAANSLVVDGTVSRTSGILTFAAGGTLNLNGSSAQNPVDLTGSTLDSVTLNNAAGATFTNTAGLTWNGGLTLTAGTLVLPNVAQTITGSVTGAGTLNASAIAGTLQVGGSLTAAVFTAPTTLELYGAAAASLNGYNLNNLILNKTAVSNTVTSLGGVTVTGSLTLTQGTWAAGTFSHQIAGDWNSSAVNFTLTPGTSTITLTKAGTLITTKTTDTFNNLDIESGGALQGTSLLTVGGNLTVGNVTAAALTDNGGGTSLAVTGTAAVTAGTNALSWVNTSNKLATVNIISAGAVTLVDQDGYNVYGTSSGAADFSSTAGSITVPVTRSYATTGTATQNWHPGGDLQLNGSVTTVGGLMTLNPAGTIYLNLAGTVVSGTGTGAVTLNRPVVLQQSATISTTNANVTFNSTVNPTTASTQGLTLVAGLGNITVTGPVGGSKRLGGLTVTSGATVAFTGAVTAKSLTQSAGSVSTTFSGAQDYTNNFTFTGTALAISAAMNVAGSLTLTSGTFSTNANGVTVTGAVNTSGGTLNLGTNGTLTVGGNLTLGTLGYTTSSTITFNGSTQTFTPNAQALSHVTVASTGTVTLGGSMTQAAANGALTLTSGILDAGGYTITLGANLTLANSSTLKLSNGELTDGAGTYNVTVNQAALDSSGTGQIVLNGTFTVANASAVVNVGTNTFTVGAMSASAGTFTQSGVNTGSDSVTSLSVSGATVTWDSPAAGGTLAVTGSITAASGTLNFNKKNVTLGTGLTGNVTFYDLTIPAGTALIPGAGTTITVSHNMTIANGGHYDSTTNSPALILGGASSAAGGTYTDGNATLENLGTVSITGTQSKALASGLHTKTLTITGTTLNLSGNSLTVDGNLTGTGGFIASGSESITVGGNLSVSTFTPANSTVNLNGTAQALTTNAQPFYNLTLTSGAASAVTVTGVLAVGGNLEVQSGRTLLMGTNALTVTGTTNAAATNAGTITSSSGTQTFTGSFEIGSLTASSSASSPFTSFGGATVTLHTFSANSGTVVFNGGTTQTFNSNAQTLNTLQVGTAAVGTTLTLTSDLTLTGNVIFLGLSANNATLNAAGHNLTIAGSWNNSSAYGVFQNAATVTFNNTATQTINSGSGAAAAAAGKQFNTLIVNGSGILQLSGPLAVTGPLTQNAGSTFDLNAQTLLVKGTLTINAAAAANFLVAGSTVSLDAVSAVNLSSSQPFYNLIVNAPGGTITQTSTLTVSNRFMAFRGTWKTNGFWLNVGEDFVAYGTGYADYTVNGTTYHPADDGELAGSRAASYFENLLGYPYWSPVGPGGAGGVGPYYDLGSAVGYSALANSAFTTPVWTAALAYTYSTGSYGNVTKGTQNANFVLNGGSASEYIQVGRNFYNYGAGMSGTGSWSLNLAAKYTAKKLNQSKTTDWFGEPFAVALGTMTITNSLASVVVAAAQTNAGGTYTPGTTSVSPNWTSAVTLSGTTNWDNTRPDIDTVTANLPATRFDNLVEITFTKSIIDDNSEANSATVSSPAASLDALRFAGGATNAGGVYNFSTTTSAATASNTVLSFRTYDSALNPTWNTDATGISAGNLLSTDREGNHQTVVPDVRIEKGRLYDTSGNPIVNHDGLNYNGTTVSAVVTSAIDETKPVLLKVELGQARKGFQGTEPLYAEDGHNYWHLVWSEPVNFPALAALNWGGSQIGSVPTAEAASGNVTATSSLGASYTDGSPANTVHLAGLADYTGSTLYIGSRTYFDTNALHTESAAKALQSSITVTNSMARSSPVDLYIYLVGASSGTGTSRIWDGFWWSDSTASPSNLSFKVPSATASDVKDLALNPVEDESYTWKQPSSASDPKTGLVTTNATVTGTNGANSIGAQAGWESGAPTFSPANDGTGAYELVPIDSNTNDKIDQIQFHILSAGSLPGSAWLPSLHPDLTQSRFGIRDSSLADFYHGLSLSTDDSTFTTSYNKAVVTTAPYNGNTGVDNTLFDGAGSAFAVSDDGYFTMPVDDSLSGVPDTWEPITAYWAKYDPFVGMATNLPGRLLEPPVDSATSFKALDRTPPRIALTLSGKDLKYIYVQFSRPVSNTNGAGALKLVNTTNSITAIQYLSGGTAGNFQEALLTLASPLAASDLGTAKIQGTTDGNIVSGVNHFDVTITYPVTSVGLNLVEPIWASDGSGAEANTSGTDHVIHDFTGLSDLAVRNITIQSKVFGGTVFDALPLRLFYDVKVPSSNIVNGVWLPSGIPSYISGVVPSSGNDHARHVDPTSSNTAGDLKNFVLPGNDSEFASESSVQFMFQLGALPILRALDPSDPRQMAPWSFKLKAIRTQKNGVTILNNVIDPTKGQKTQVLYTTKRSGVVTVEVFTLDGSAVQVLHRDRQASGTYSVYWDGKNSSGAVVARGIYFVRVVGPDIDEIRNILVIK